MRDVQVNGPWCFPCWTFLDIVQVNGPWVIPCWTFLDIQVIPCLTFLDIVLVNGPRVTSKTSSPTLSTKASQRNMSAAGTFGVDIGTN